MAKLDLTQLLVRDATEEDLDALEALRPLGARHGDHIRAAHPARSRYLLADLDEQIVGTVLLYFTPEAGWDRRDQLPLMLDLWVPEHLRSQGIGTALVAGAEQFAMAAGFGHLYLRVEPDRNPRAFALYKRLGYQALQNQPYEDSHHFVDSAGNVHEGVEWVVDMRKWLA